MSDPEANRNVCQVRGCPYTAHLPRSEVVHGDPNAPTGHTLLLCAEHRAQYSQTTSQTWLEDNIPGLRR
jgi:hypothetical protein